MDATIETILAEYEARAEREWGGGVEGSARAVPNRRDQMLLSVGRGAGQFLNTLARDAGAKRILELGTSYGYSTMWLADAAKAAGGKVTSVDLADYKQAHARDQLRRAGLEAQAEFLTGDVLQILPTLKGLFDFVLLDVWKDIYVPCLELTLPLLGPGAIVVADNMLLPAAVRPDALAYRRLVRAQPGVSSVLLPIGQGLEVSRMAGPDDEGL